MRLAGAFILWTIIVFSMPICAWSTDGNAVAQKVYDRDDGKDSYARLKMLLIDKKGHKRLRTLITAVKDYGTLSKSYTRFYTPSAIDGTTFLTWEVHDSDNDQFLYLPALRRVRRVVSRQKKNRFVNTDFTFEDLERRKVSLDSHRILKVEAYSGYSCWVLESIPKEKESSQYGKRVSWIAKDLHMALRIDFYDSRGNLVKRMLNRNLKKIDGIWTAMDSEMQDLKRRSRTILRITQVKYNKGIPDHIFSKEYMRHGK